MIKHCCIILSFLAICSCGLCAQPDLPGYQGYINDFSGILDSSTENLIESIIIQVESKTTAQIAIITIPTTGDSEIGQYSVALFEKWGIGQKGKDNGILIVVAVNDRKIWVETGYGLEGALPDALCSKIIYQIITPEFKKNDFSKGLLLGTIAVAELIAKEYNVKLDFNESLSGAREQVMTKQKKGSLAASLLYLLLFLFFFGLRSGLLFYFLLGPTGRRRGGYWYGSGFGGSSGGFGNGFGGFGGGMTGGGGAGGSW